MNTHSPGALIVFVSCPPHAASALAQTLVELKLAACVNILPSISSVYRWQHEVQRDEESLLLIKTTRTGYPALEQAVREHHPYELPEILAVTVEAGLPAYLNWLRDAIQ